MVEERRVNYVNSKKLEKVLVAHDIIAQWRKQKPPGRFLKFDDKTELWNDVGDEKARKKTSDALYTNVIQWRKQQEEQWKEKQMKDHDDIGVDVATDMPAMNSPTHNIGSHNSDDSVPPMPSLNSPTHNIGSHNSDDSVPPMPVVNSPTHNIGFHNSDDSVPPMPALVTNDDTGSTILNSQIVRTIAAQRWLNVSKISIEHTIFARALSCH